MNKRANISSIVLIIISVFSLVGAVVFALSGKMLPIALAELISIKLSFYSGGSLAYGLLCSFLFAFALIEIVLASLTQSFRKIILIIPAALIYLADAIIHFYAFLFVSGYSWGYLISALLDILVIILVFAGFKDAKKEESAEEISTKESEEK